MTNALRHRRSNTMTTRPSISDIAFTPTVKRAQQDRGSRELCVGGVPP